MLFYHQRWTKRPKAKTSKLAPRITDPNSLGPGSTSGRACKEKQPKTTHRLVFVTAEPARSQARKQSGFVRECLSFHAVIESSCGLRLCISGFKKGSPRRYIDSNGTTLYFCAILAKQGAKSTVDNTVLWNLAVTLTLQICGEFCGLFGNSPSWVECRTAPGS